MNRSFIKKIFGILTPILFVGCGDGVSTRQPLVATTIQSQIDFKALSNLSPMAGHDCSGIGTRHESQGSFGSSALDGVDLWNFNTNCTIESFSCGNVGYVISDDWATTQNPNHMGVIEFQITDRYKSPDSDSYCFEVGRHRCQYEMEPFGHQGEFKWTCQFNPQ